MKIAKKVLAVVMAIAMIGCLTAMAFAAGKTVYSIEASKPDEDGVVTVKLYANNMVGLKSGAIEFKYDKNVLEFDYDDDGEDAAMANLTKKNSFTKELNPDLTIDDSAAFKFGFYFKEALWTADEFAANAKKAGTVTVNSDKFELGVLYFNVKDENATETKFEIVAADTTAEGVTAEAAKDVVVVLKEAKEEPTSGKKEEPTSGKKEEPTSKKADESTTKIVVEPTSKKANGGDQPNTGDNMALAAAAGVVALAGAAFIISKKRK